MMNANETPARAFQKIGIFIDTEHHEPLPLAAVGGGIVRVALVIRAETAKAVLVERMAEGHGQAWVPRSMMQGHAESILGALTCSREPTKFDPTRAFKPRGFTFASWFWNKIREQI